MKQKVLVVGGGGREHALGWALSRSPSVERVDAAPGNPGLAALGRTHPVAADDLDGLVSLARSEAYDLVVVGPEQPLALGAADRLREAGLAVFGPGASGARLEASKAFAKEFMVRHGVPTAEYRVVGDAAEGRRVLGEWGAPLVVKASGLAAGKGVILAGTEAEAERALEVCFGDRAFGDAGSTVVLERMLVGEEASVFVLTDGSTYHLLPGSQDHKRALDGDRGPNTGGMGAYSPAPCLETLGTETIRTRVVEPVLAGLQAEEIPFRGLLYIGLMLTESGPRVLEFNVRFGDPETQAVLPRLDWDLGTLFLETARGALSAGPLPEPRHRAAACVVAAAGDYPRSGSRGAAIGGVEEAEALGALVFHAGTAAGPDGLVTAGGRVLAVTGTGATLREAVDLAYRGIHAVHFEGMRYRNDIGHRALGAASRG